MDLANAKENSRLRRRPRILAGKDIDCSFVAKTVVHKLNSEMPSWNTELLASYCRKQEKEAVRLIREIQFTDKPGTYDEYLEDTNARWV